MLNNLTVEQLKAKLSSLSLDTRGNKAALISRLENYTKENQNNSDSSESIKDGCEYEDTKSSFEEENESEPEEKSTTTKTLKINLRESDSSNMSKTEETASTSSPCRITVKDIDNLVSKFSGDDNLSITSWFKEFEELSNLLQWSDIKKYIIVKKQLRGSAQSFIRTCACTSYEDFKVKLNDEFKVKVCKADVYNQLQRRRLQKNEQFREYVYKMQEISQLMKSP